MKYALQKYGRELPDMSPDELLYYHEAFRQATLIFNYIYPGTTEISFNFSCIIAHGPSDRKHTNKKFHHVFTFPNHNTTTFSLYLFQDTLDLNYHETTHQSIHPISSDRNAIYGLLPYFHRQLR